MECYRCGTVVDGEDFCPNCGADIGCTAEFWPRPTPATMTDWKKRR